MMKLRKNLPELFLLVFLTYMSIFIPSGIWHSIIGLIFDFEYLQAIQNLGFVFSSIIIIWIMKTYFKEVYLIFINSVKEFKKKIGIAFLTFSIVMFSYFFAIILFKYLGKSSLTIYSIEFSSETNFIFKFFCTQIIVIITEEIIFRGFFLNAVINKTNNRLAGILLSSIIFSIGHFHYDSLLDFIAASWIGIFLCILFLHYKSIYPPIFFHLGWNFSNNFFLINENPLIKIEYFEFLTPDITRQVILFIISLILSVKFRKEIIHFIKAQHNIIKPDLEPNT